MKRKKILESRLICVTLIIVVLAFAVSIILSLQLRDIVNKTYALALAGKEVPALYSGLVSVINPAVLITAACGVVMTLIARYGFRETAQSFKGAAPTDTEPNPEIENQGDK